MKNHHYFNFIMGFVALTVILTAGCTKEKQPPITIGINPWPGYEFLYLAQQKGFYEAEGIDVKIVEYGSLSDVRRGFERGKLDAMAVTLIEVLQVKHNSSRDPVVFLVSDYSDGGDVILGRDEIHNIADLKGKRVGADTSSLPVFLLARALDQAGLSLQDIELFPLEQLAMEDAYVKGDIDVAVTYPPVSVRLADRDDTHQLFSSSKIPGEIVDVVAMERSVFNARPDAVNAIMKAWDRALDYAQQHPEDAHQIMAEREGITSAEFADALSGLVTVTSSQQDAYFGPDGSLKKTIHHVANTLSEIGALEGEINHECCLPETTQKK